jgi:DHA2 family multidrug resistance protein
MLDRGITQQAAMIAYLDDFKLMFVATLVAVPLLILIRKPGAHSADVGSHAAID